MAAAQDELASPDEAPLRRQAARPIYRERGVFDASYFKTALNEQLTATATKSTVEVHLMNAHMHRIRAVLAAEPTYVVFDAYRQRVDGGRSEQYWGAAPAPDDAMVEMVRVIVAYDAIAEIVITAAAETSVPRIGFSRA
jgi:hypothetical protein